MGKSYLEYQLMHILLDNFHQGGKYSAQIASHQEELIRERNFNNQKYLSITSLQTEYLNFDRSSGSVSNNERANIVQKNALFVEVIAILHRICFKG